MRYSPYEMKDYGLQHRGGTVMPFSINPAASAVEQEAFWNLLWLSVPEVDAYLDLRYEDFDSFNAMLLTFPQQKWVLVCRMLQDAPALTKHLATATPVEFLASAAPSFDRLAAAAPPSFREWYDTVKARAGVAQALLDVRDAAAICQAVIAVDFKAGKRL